MTELRSMKERRRKPARRARGVKDYRIDAELLRRSGDRNGYHTSRVIVTLVPGAQLPPEFKKFARATRLDLINGEVLELPNHVLAADGGAPVGVPRALRPADRSHNYRTSLTVGARTVQESLGYTGAGIGVAVIDSGITRGTTT